MTKIANFDKAALKALREPIEAELKALGERLGITFKVGNGTFSGIDASFKLEMKVDDPAAIEAGERKKWDANCRYIGRDYNRPDETGLRPEDFGTEFSNAGTRYVTTGISVGRSKYPIACKIISGPKAGQTVGFTDMAVATIRAATDAKKAAAA